MSRLIPCFCSVLLATRDSQPCRPFSPVCGRTSSRLAESSGEFGEVRASRSSSLRMATAKRAANSARGAESVLSDELVSIRALRVCAVASQAGDVGQCQSLCLESYPVRVGDSGKRVVGETSCELWEGAFNVVVDGHSETTDCDPVSVQPSCPVWHQVECSTSRPLRYSCCLQYPNCRRAWATATISTVSPTSRYTRLYG